MSAQYLPGKSNKTGLTVQATAVPPNQHWKSDFAQQLRSDISTLSVLRCSSKHWQHKCCHHERRTLERWDVTENSKLPSDSHGHIEPDMKPFWHLGILASSFIMLNESTENTLYNVAQVANITQLVGALQKFKYELIIRNWSRPPPSPFKPHVCTIYWIHTDCQ